MPQLSDDVIFIALILGIAVFIFVALLAGVIAMVISQNRQIEGITISTLVNMFAGLIRRAKPNEEPVSPVLKLDEPIPNPSPDIEFESVRQPIVEKHLKGIQTLNWWVCFVIATYVAWLNYSRLGSDLKMTSLYDYFVMLAIISPACLAVAWLRLTGMKWLQALLLFMWVPAAFLGIQFIVAVVSIFFH